VVGEVVDVLQLSACSAFGLLLSFQTTFIDLVFAVGAQVFSNAEP